MLTTRGQWGQKEDLKNTVRPEKWQVLCRTLGMFGGFRMQSYSLNLNISNGIERRHVEGIGLVRSIGSCRKAGISSAIEGSLVSEDGLKHPWGLWKLMSKADFHQTDNHLTLLPLCSWPHWMVQVPIQKWGHPWLPPLSLPKAHLALCPVAAIFTLDPTEDQLSAPGGFVFIFPCASPCGFSNTQPWLCHFSFMPP